MQPSIQVIKTATGKADQVILLGERTAFEKHIADPLQKAYLSKKLEKGETTHVFINFFEKKTFFVYIKPNADPNYLTEEFRKKAFELTSLLNAERTDAFELIGDGIEERNILAFCEGVALSNYQFLKYKSEKKENSLKTIHLVGNYPEEKIAELNNLIKANYITRDLVNEPVIYLTAEQFSEDMQGLGKEAGFVVEVFNETKIRSLKMGGLLAVNEGSPNPPTFNILEYKPSGATNSKPVILVGKGVVYDTGGLSLKPTPQSMDYMKCDMAGGAAVVGTIYAVAKNKLPIHVVGLIPATENRPDGNAITPGDVITMFSGKTVEVLNTDAEGRLILADALTYASKYDPELVIDLATLTGSAQRATGKEGSVFMGTASEKYKTALKDSGYRVYERLVEFPLWEEYGKLIESEIADIKNLGGADAGAITAGKFLEHFVTYPWIHMDIAGTAFLHAPDYYRGKNATAVGVRLLYDFLKTNF
jgi:leucyl aminopeptidase